MAASELMVIISCLVSGQPQTAWDFEIYAPLNPNPQIRRAQFQELHSAIRVEKGRLTLESGPEQVLDDVQANWIPGSIPKGAEGGLHKVPLVRSEEHTSELQSH